jgi:hypothetical protein
MGIFTRTKRDKKVRSGSSRRRQERENLKKSSGVSSRRPPPVLSRSELGINTAVLDNRSIPRRRVDVQLSTPGAEIRLPAVPTVSNKWRLVSGILSISLMLVLIMVTNTGYFQVKGIQTHGLERFTEAEIVQAINIKGSPIFFIHPEKIKQDLQHTYPGLSEVEVEVSWPANVLISLKERYPVLAWNWEGHVRWVDENGVAFEPHDLGLDVVQVNSAMLPPTVQDRFVDPRIVKTVSTLRDYLPEGTELIFNADHGLGWNDDRGWIVYFGFNDDDAAQKMIVYQALVDYLEKKRITPALINIEFLNAPYFRMKL